MLATPVFAFNPQSLGGGQYTVELFWQSALAAQFLNLGDHITDTALNTYEVIAPTTIPNSDGATITLQFITTDTAPIEDTDFDSTAFTPGQADLRPVFRTAGSIGTQSLFSAPDYEYTVTASWVSSVEANKAQVGDSIVDSLGKEFEITFLDTGRFADPFRVTEKERVGIAPALGTATLFRATNSQGFFQGTPLTDPARTTIFLRDEAATDVTLNDIQTTLNNLSAESTASPYPNNSGSTILKARPVYVNSSGDINLIDVSVEAQVLSIQGITNQDIPTATSGNVITSGIVKDISVPASVGDGVYISKAGTLTATKPSIGVASFVEGDFVVYVGSIKENENNPSLKDLKLDIQIIGQL